MKTWQIKSSLWLLILSVACQSKPLDDVPNESANSGGTAATAGGNNAGGANDAGAGSDSLGEPVLVQALRRAHISSDASDENFQRAVAELDFGSAPVARATLRVTLESPCFPFAGWAEQGVPDGQRWPAHCDAFDRTLSVALDEPEPMSSGAPGLELLRAITPFGGPLEVETDVTDVVNGLPGSHELALRIDTWSDADGLVSGSQGEWIASAELRLWPGTPPRRVLQVLPLVRGSQTEPDAEPVSFQVPAGVGSARIEYRVTGHGAVFSPGCLGPAEEFCQRTHQLFLDGESLQELTPWRDCSDNCTLTANPSGFGPSQYCAQNPCGDPSSARAPRANWCPGTQTEPFVLEDPALQVAGEHELTRSIPELSDGGIWTVSATYFAFD